MKKATFDSLGCGAQRAVAYAMSSKLALKQLSVISGKTQQEKGIQNTIKKRRKARKKHQALAQQQREQAQTTYKQNLQYYQQTQATQDSTAELMSKVNLQQACAMLLTSHVTNHTDILQCCCCVAVCWVRPLREMDSDLEFDI